MRASSRTSNCSSRSLIRLTSLVGNSETGKINFHVIFSDQVAADSIEQFFLRALNVTLNLDGAKEWHGCVGINPGLEALGEAMRKATPPGKLNQSLPQPTDWLQQRRSPPRSDR